MGAGATLGPRLFAQNLLAAAAYWGSATLVRWYFTQYQMWPAAIWLPAGIALFVALAVGRWSWPGIFLGAMLTNTVSFGEPAARAAVLSLGNTIAPILAEELVRARIRKEEPFARVIEVLFFGLGALVDGMIAATMGATTIWAQTSAPLRALPTRWFEWTLSDAGGCLLLAPLFLLARSERSSNFGVSTALSVLSVVYLLFGTTGILAADARASFLILSPLLWMAVRLSLEIAYPMLVLVMGATMAGTLEGYGPFSGVPRGGMLAIFAQMANGFGASVLLLGGAASEQALRKLNLDLRRASRGADRPVAREPAAVGKSSVLRSPCRLAQPAAAAGTLWRLWCGGAA